VGGVRPGRPGQGGFGVAPAMNETLLTHRGTSQSPAVVLVQLGSSPGPWERHSLPVG
jgi:hypothetical protein